MLRWRPSSLAEELDNSDGEFRDARLNLDTAVKEESATITRKRGRGELLEALVVASRVVAWPENIPTWKVQEAQVEMQNLLKELDGESTGRE